MKKNIAVALVGILLCIELLPVSAQATDEYEQAYKLFDQSNYQQALIKFEALLEQAPNNAALIYDIGLCHHYLKNYQQADFYFTQLLPNPEYEFWATYQLAINDWQQGDYGAAEIGLSRVVFASNDADLASSKSLSRSIVTFIVKSLEDQLTLRISCKSWRSHFCHGRLFS